jgi:hypothetical protein
MKNLIIALSIMSFALNINAQSTITVYKKNGDKIEINNAKAKTSDGKVYVTKENGYISVYSLKKIDSISGVEKDKKAISDIPLGQPATHIYNFHSQPIKGDNLIAIVADSNTENNYMNFGRYLIDKGFSFKFLNKDFHIIETDEVTVKGGYKYRLSVSFKDSIIYIRPKYNSATWAAAITMDMSVPLVWIDWKHTTSRSEHSYKAYEKFEPILHEYGKEVLYSNTN